MAATYSSDLHTKQVATGASLSKIATRDLHGKKRYVRLSYTVVTALVTTDMIDLFKLPPNARLLLDDCRIKVSADQGAGTHIDIGNRAYRGRDGVDVAADPDSLVDGWDAATTAKEVLETSAGAMGTLVDSFNTVTFDSQEPVGIYMTCLDAGGTYDGDVADTLEFEFVYVTD